jgi:hypothetical protein
MELIDVANVDNKNINDEGKIIDPFKYTNIKQIVDNKAVHHLPCCNNFIICCCSLVPKYNCWCNVCRAPFNSSPHDWMRVAKNYNYFQLLNSKKLPRRRRHFKTNKALPKDIMILILDYLKFPFVEKLLINKEHSGI